MDWLFILEKVISWGIPLLCTALMAKFITPRVKAQERGQELLEQEEWDEHSKKLVERIEKIEKGHTADKEEIIQKIENMHCGDAVIHDALANIITKLDENKSNTYTKLEEMDKKNTRAFIQIYQRDLIVDGKTYIAAKYWTPNQKANFFQRYKQYKDWGGNGDVEPWIEKLKTLPIRYPEVEEFNEK